MPGFPELTENSLTTIARLEKFRGHLYNWYNTKNTAAPRTNPFVSTVDSGNFVASLYTLHTGTLTLLQEAPGITKLFTGLRPHWEMMQPQGKLSPLHYPKISVAGHSGRHQ